MSTSATRTVRPAPQGRERIVKGSRGPVFVQAIWAALVMNVLTFGTTTTVVPLPTSIGKMIAQGSLPVALLLALVANRRGLVRVNLFMSLLTVLAVLGLLVSLHNEFFLGSTYRAVRFLLFLTVLWLLTPWYGRRDMLLLRCHRRVLWVALGTVLLGAAISPGSAFSFEGRLGGVIWPIWPTGVAHFAATLFGTTVVLWTCRVITGRNATLALVISGAVLIATHTRTAVTGTVVGLIVATASLMLGHVRARRVALGSGVATVVAAMFFASALTTWALRGQSTSQVGELTGRTKVWTDVFDTPRPMVEQVFGSGLSNQSFNGLPIDSSWVSVFVDQGLIGVFLLATAVLLLFLMAATRERGPQRAAALFLLTYCVVASITETGLGAAAPYQLDLVVAAALLMRPAPGGGG
ncbi:membrane protein [Phycicoccus ginsengisoli]